MARSHRIYIAFNQHHELLGAFTVKHELISHFKRLKERLPCDPSLLDADYDVAQVLAVPDGRCAGWADYECRDITAEILAALA